MNVKTDLSTGGTELIELDLPDSCPVCLSAIVPIDIHVRFLKKATVESLYRCPHRDCERFFISRYSFSGRRGNGTGVYTLIESVPLTFSKTEFEKTITEISPDFVAIYGQAEAAEGNGLMLACGPAYRKAIEFLIKDYVIRLHPEETEQIKRMPLARCIAEFVDSERIKAIAARAVWLGNDETHYERKWQGKDLQDLKSLIALSVHWIEMEELTAAVLKDMPEADKETAAKVAETGKI